MARVRSWIASIFSSPVKSIEDSWLNKSELIQGYFKRTRLIRRNFPGFPDDNYSRKITLGLLAFFITQFALLMLGEFDVGYPILHFLFIGNAKFADFIDGLVLTPAYFSNILASMDTFSQPQGPPVLVFYDFWRSLTPDLAVPDSKLIKIHQIVLILLLMTLLFVWVLSKVSKSSHFAILLALSYPYLFLFGRGNPDLICAILLALAIWAIQKSRFPISAILMGLMGAFKVPYLLFAVVFIPIKRIKMLILTGFSFLVFFFGSLLTRPYGMTEQLKTFQIITERYFRDYAVGDGGHLFNTSMFGLVKGFAYLFPSQEFQNIAQLYSYNKALLNAYYALIFGVLLVVLFLYRRRSGGFSIPPVNSLPEILFASTLILILLPQVSAEYRLAMLLPSLAWLLGSNSKILTPKFLVLVAILFIPKYFVHFQFEDGFRGQFALGTLVNPILLLIILLNTVIFIAEQSSLPKMKSRRK
jgi:hypothetical protein